MTQQVYIDQILESVVKLWLNTKQEFVLEEDEDSEHESAYNENIVQR